jgi:RNA polymerase sigma factor (sigma-70 family)
VQPFRVEVRQNTMSPVAEVPCDQARPQGLEQLYRRHWAELVRLATLLSGSRDVAEDVVQDAFLRLHRSGTLPEKPLPYLRRSVVNGVIDHRRRKTVESTYRWSTALTESLPEVPRLTPHLERLSQRQRDALVLRYYLDLPLKEIAKLLGCSVGTIKSHIHRGLATLRKDVEA